VTPRKAKIKQAEEIGNVVGAAKLNATLEDHLKSTDKRIFLNPARARVCMESPKNILSKKAAANFLPLMLDVKGPNLAPGTAPKRPLKAVELPEETLWPIAAPPAILLPALLGEYETGSEEEEEDDGEEDQFDEPCDGPGAVAVCPAPVFEQEGEIDDDGKSSDDSGGEEGLGGKKDPDHETDATEEREVLQSGPQFKLQTRGLYITKAMRAEHGDTKSCRGCLGIQTTHDKECQERFEILCGRREAPPTEEAPAASAQEAAPASSHDAQSPAADVDMVPGRGAEKRQLDEDKPAASRARVAAPIGEKRKPEGATEDVPEASRIRTGGPEDSDMMSSVFAVIEDVEDDVREAVHNHGNLDPRQVCEGRDEERKRLKHFEVYDGVKQCKPPCRGRCLVATWRPGRGVGRCGEPCAYKVDHDPENPCICQRHVDTQDGSGNFSGMYL